MKFHDVSSISLLSPLSSSGVSSDSTEESVNADSTAADSKAGSTADSTSSPPSPAAIPTPSFTSKSRSIRHPVEDIIHHSIYNFYLLVKEIKLFVTSLKEKNQHIIDEILHPHYDSSNHTDSSSSYKATHTSSEIIREYALEISMVLIMVILTLAMFSIISTMIFLISLWMLYHTKRAAEDQK